MGSPNNRVPKSPLKQWVLYQEVDVCTGIVVIKKLKIKWFSVMKHCIKITQFFVRTEYPLIVIVFSELRIKIIFTCEKGEEKTFVVLKNRICAM